ncbi:uracil-DNA glycosylase [Devosia pacifica]|uniref:Type-5 uracil-DNA glycosylase n=1 Tax=Devosia pacifica TaxID=1335967 RepID=A0A918SD05_9HYPH|nr:uracil-DNA glycosylase [Devosia pacifica]GHA36297.1 uracil-DNA glycosylase [Devosia pacifica]
MTDINPPPDCPLCPRLAAFRDENQQKFPEYFNAPVPVWTGAATRLVVVGLAPGLKGANRTGRPFTGDYAGDLLYATLKKYGLAHGEYEQRQDDSLTLDGASIVNAVRCVPPQNKPTPAEIHTCRPFLQAVFDAEPQAKTYLVLGRIAHESVLRALGQKLSAFPFKHGAQHTIGVHGVTVFDSYHCSRYNTNTGVLTEQMFEDVVGAAARHALKHAES